MMKTLKIVCLLMLAFCWGTKAEGLFIHSNFVCTRFHGTEPFYDLFLASYLKVPRATRCTSWRETCLASAIALRLVNQRARAANR